jgi:hypothetical protein
VSYRQAMRPTAAAMLSVPAITAMALGMTGCFTSGADFGSDAESYIEGDDALRAELFPDDDTSFTEATCVEPPSSDVGETFSCTAVDSSGGTWEFRVEITGSSEYQVEVSRFPEGG